MSHQDRFPESRYIFDPKEKSSCELLLKLYLEVSAIVDLLSSDEKIVVPIDTFNKIQVYLESYPSLYKSHKLPNELKDVTELNLEIVKFMKIASENELKERISFEIFYNFLRIFGHSTKFYLLEPILHKIIHTQFSHNFSSSMSEILKNLKSSKISLDLITRVNDLVFVVYLSQKSFGLILENIFIKNLINVCEVILIFRREEDNFDQLIETAVIIACDFLISYSQTCNRIDKKHLFLAIKQYHNFYEFLKNYDPLTNRLFHEIKSDLSDSEHLESLHFLGLDNKMVGDICEIFPHFTSENARELLTVYRTPEIVISKLINEPHLCSKYTSSNPKKMTAEKIKYEDSFDDLKEINLKLVAAQDLEDQKKILETKIKIIKSLPTPEDYIFDDDFDESADECGMINYNIKEEAIVDEIISEDFAPDCQVPKPKRIITISNIPIVTKKMTRK